MVTQMVDRRGAAVTGDVPPIRFAPARGARIAYQDFGSGPTIVAVPPLAQNIEMAWEREEVRTMFEGFGSFSRWVQFDKRGTGASDRRSQVPGLDERVDDLRAVMDHAEIERAFIYGASEGGPMCVLFAATYPDRVEGMILHGSTANFHDPDMTDERRQIVDEQSRYLVDKWGTSESILADFFSPSLAGDQGYRQWLERYERLSTDRDSLRELLALMSDFDVTELLSTVDVPTLVMHRSGDMVIPVQRGRDLAAAIPGARFYEQDGNDHFAFAGDRAWMDELERFVTGSVRSSTVDAPGGRNLPATRPTVTIQTLGRFAVEVDGEEVPTSAWGSRLARQLCKRLVAARGWPVTREELFDLLWPDEHNPQKLGARLSVQLSAVRRVLKGAVIADRQTVALNLDEVSTDLERFLAASFDDAIVAGSWSDHHHHPPLRPVLSDRCVGFDEGGGWCGRRRLGSSAQPELARSKLRRSNSVCSRYSLPSIGALPSREVVCSAMVTSVPAAHGCRHQLTTEMATVRPSSSARLLV